MVIYEVFMRKRIKVFLRSFALLGLFQAWTLYRQFSTPPVHINAYQGFWLVLASF